MALKLNTPALDTAFTTIQTKAKQVKEASISAKARLEAGNVDAREIVGYARNLRIAHDVMAANKTITGLGDYAKTELSDAAYDYVAEVTAVQAAMASCYGWVNTNLPRDASGYLLIEKFVDGMFEQRQVTPAQSAGLVTLINTLLTTFG